MAIQSNLYFKGRQGKLVFYKRLGVPVIRTQSEEVKLSPASIVRSNNLGIASAAASALRKQLLPLLPFPTDASMQKGLCSAFIRWLGRDDPASLPPCNPVPFLNGFSFNAASSIGERFKVATVVTQPAANTIQVAIPTFVPRDVIAAPAYTISINCIIAAASVSVQPGLAVGSSLEQFTIPWNDTVVAPQNILLPVPMGPHILTVTAARLQYCLSSGDCCSLPGFMPASILDAVFG